MSQGFEQQQYASQSFSSAYRNHHYQSMVAQSENKIKQITQDMILLNAINSVGSRLTVDNFNALSNNNNNNTNSTQGASQAPLSRVSYNQASSSGSAANNHFYSEIEAAILRSTMPLNVNESEEITVNGERGIWINKAEIANWRGSLPLTQYQINDDPYPEIIRKKTDQQLQYMQEVAIR